MSLETCICDVIVMWCDVVGPQEERSNRFSFEVPSLTFPLLNLHDRIVDALLPTNNNILAISVGDIGVLNYPNIVVMLETTDSASFRDVHDALRPLGLHFSYLQSYDESQWPQSSHYRDLESAKAKGKFSDFRPSTTSASDEQVTQ